MSDGAPTAPPIRDEGARVLSPTDQKIDAQPTLLAVLVLYEMRASDSPTLVSLCKSLAESDVARQFRLLIYDNSASPSPLPAIPVPFSYIHDPTNGGLVTAYNTALGLAQEGRNEWLLLLDQDTVLTSDYLNTLFRTLCRVRMDARCAALVPKLVCGNKVVSPVRVLWGGRLAPVDQGRFGTVLGEPMALNSATLLRVSAILEIGGFDHRFWLDYLDHWVFNRLHRARYTLYVIDAVLHHELSVRSTSDISLARYRNVLLAEGKFYRSCKSRTENALYQMRLLLRSGKVLAKPNGFRRFLLTLGHMAAHARARKE
jgi:GT2 family glycosyltransferase